MTVHFEFASKADLSQQMPRLFEILHGNMHEIAHSGRSYEEDYLEWYGSVFPAMQKAPRQMVLMQEEVRLIGFFMYYVNEDRFVMEEIQLCRELQGKGVFKAFFGWLLPKLPRDVRWVEAYAHRDNLKSHGILYHLGLVPTNADEAGEFFHFRGSFEAFEKSFSK